MHATTPNCGLGIHWNSAYWPRGNEQVCIVWFQKISIVPHRRDWKFQGGGGGVSKSQKFKAMYEAKLEFPEGWGGGVIGHIPSMVRGVWIFSGTTHFCMWKICFSS